MIGTDLEYAKSLLERNELVAIPTETVYGLAGNAFDVRAVSKIFEAKDRPFFDPLIVHTSDLRRIEEFVVHISEQAQVLAARFWPGPLTLLLPKNKLIPDLVTAGSDLVGVRVPHHPLTLKLLKSLSFPLAAPSANPFGYISPTRAKHVADQLGSKIGYILDGGECRIGLESTIVGFEGKNTIVYRIGGIPIENIEKIVGKVQIKIHSDLDVTAPGMLKSHYAPSKSLFIANYTGSGYTPEETGILSFSTFNALVPEINQVILSPSQSLDEAAYNLFDALRTLDKMPVKVIFAELVPDQGLGRAINDRIKRAAVKKS